MPPGLTGVIGVRGGDVISKRTGRWLHRGELASTQFAASPRRSNIMAQAHRKKITEESCVDG